MTLVVSTGVWGPQCQWGPVPYSNQSTARMALDAWQNGHWQSIWALGMHYHIVTSIAISRKPEKTNADAYSNNFRMGITGFVSLSCVELVNKTVEPDTDLKVHNVFPKVTFPAWLHPVKIWYQTVSR